MPVCCSTSEDGSGVLVVKDCNAVTIVWIDCLCCELFAETHNVLT